MVSVIIVAAGESKRFKGSIAKPYLMLGLKPVIIRTLSVFFEESLVDEIILVIHQSQAGQIKKLLSDFSMKLKKVVLGGEKRQDSVARGLKEISPRSGIVLVHDGVRPLVRKELINEVIKEAESFGAVVPAVPCQDTIKELDKKKEVVKTLRRRALWAVQTPQGYRKELLLSAHEKAKLDDYYGTDDAELVEYLGHPVKVIDGSKENIKITTPLDLILAEAILKSRM